MQRTFNYTERSRILKDQALFSFEEEDGGAPVFNVLFNLAGDYWPADARLLVDAYFKETRQRFDFGAVSRIVPPSDRRLTGIDLSGPTLFDVIVIDRLGRLLAAGRGFRGDENEGSGSRSSILSVRKYSLDQLSWKVHFETGAGPELHLNDRIPHVVDRLRDDPVFQSLVLPAALRDILVYYLWNEEDQDSEYGQKWMAFAGMFADERPTGNDPTELLSWADEVVGEFSKRFSLADMLVDSEQEKSG